MECLYCGEKIDEEKVKEMKELGAEPFCDSECYNLYNYGNPFFEV